MGNSNSVEPCAQACAQFPRPAQVAIASFFLAFFPVLVNLRIEGIKSIFGSFAADTFFYLAVAKNSSWSPLFSFDGIYPTNGFHPLWQFLIKGLGGILNLDSEGLIYLAFASSWLFVALAAPLLVLCSYQITKRPLLALFSIFPGFVYLISAPSSLYYGNPWSFINGMESPLSILLFSILIFIALKWKMFTMPVSGNERKLLVFSLTSAFVVLSRLDDIFLIGSLAFTIWMFSPSSNRNSKTILFLSVPVIVLIGYLLLNKSYAGSFLPVSGIAKGGLSLQSNIRHAINLVFPTYYFASERWSQLAWRSILMSLPGIIGILFILTRRNKLIRLLNACIFKPRSLDEQNVVVCTDRFGLLVALSIYCVFKWLYNLTNVGIWHQGHWYYPLAIISANMIIAYTISHFLPLIYMQKGMATLLMLFLIAFNLYLSYSMDSSKAVAGYNREYYTLWANRAKITADLKWEDPNARVIEYDDGIIAYSLDVPVMSGFGFALDRDALQAKKEGRLLELAKQRGFNYVSSLYYMPDKLENAWFLGEESKKFNFSLALEDKKSGLKIYRYSTP